MVTERSDLPVTSVEDRYWVGVPMEQAQQISAAIRFYVEAVAERAGVAPSSVPLTGTALKLDIAYRTHRGSGNGTISGPPSGAPPLSSCDVAQRTGISDRAVRKAARAGRLRGELDEHNSWRFWPDDVNDWWARRRDIA